MQIAYAVTLAALIMWLLLGYDIKVYVTYKRGNREPWELGFSNQTLTGQYIVFKKWRKNHLEEHGFSTTWKFLIFPLTIECDVDTHGLAGWEQVNSCKLQ